MNHRQNFESHIMQLPEQEQVAAREAHEDMEAARLICLSALSGAAPVDAFMEVFKRLQEARKSPAK